MTDVLGTCLAWDAGVCVVDPGSGPAVTIPLADIVTGKPVPPRGSVRQRVSAREAEVRALPLWTAASTEPLGEWVLRLVTGESGRRSRRANSCLAVGDPGRPLGSAAAQVADFYAAHGRAPLAQVEAGSAVEAGLLEQGWRVQEPADAPYLVGSVVMSLRIAGSDDGVVTEVDGTRLVARISADGVEIGRGRAELNGDWLGVHGLEVAEEHRRRGLGRRLMAGLLEAGAEHGASTVWLEVDRENTAAWMLYAGLGMREHHLCRFLAAPEPR
jgi:ribosomal protein S18 acetylase RimI-like enzyme